MARIFDPDNSFFRPLGKLADVLMLSLLWVFTSLPVVTLGPASAALYDSVTRCVRGGENGPYRRYLDSFKLNFKVGAVAGLVVAAASGLLLYLHQLLLTVAVADQMGQALFSGFCVVGVFLVGAMSYVFPVLSRFTFGVGGLLAVSFRLAVAHLPTTLILGLLSLGSVLFCVNFFMLPALVVPALAALVASLLLERIFKPLMEGQTAQGE